MTYQFRVSDAAGRHDQLNFSAAFEKDSVDDVDSTIAQLAVDRFIAGKQVYVHFTSQNAPKTLTSCYIKGSGDSYFRANMEECQRINRIGTEHLPESSSNSSSSFSTTRARFRSTDEASDEINQERTQNEGVNEEHVEEKPLFFIRPFAFAFKKIKKATHKVAEVIFSFLKRSDSKTSDV